MPEAGTSRRSRRGALWLGYTLATALLLYVVADDLAWFHDALASLTQLAPAGLQPADPSAGLTILALAGLAGIAAGLAFWVSRRSGSGFGLLCVLTVTVILFPYARIPWGRVLGAPAGQTYTAPLTAWLLAAAIVVLATVEVASCARERLAEELTHRGLDSHTHPSAFATIRRAHQRWLAGSLFAGGLIVVAFGLLHPATETLAGGLDLLWVPALAGLVAGVGLWLLARE